VGLQGRKARAAGDQGINSIEIALQVVQLTTNRSFDFAAAWLFLLGNIEEVGTCFATVIARTVLRRSTAWSLRSLLKNPACAKMG
jgi:hypothetical protein